MSRVVTNTGVLTANPSGVNSDHAYYSINNPNNGNTGTSSSTYAQIRLTSGSRAVTYIYYDFNTSSIPQNATITSVACSAKVYLSNVTAANVATKQCQLFTGTTAKGNASSVTNAIRTIELDVGSSWTRAELDNVHVRLYAVRGTSNTSTNYYFRFYGAELTVNYTYNENYYTVTASSSTSGVTVSPASQEYSEGDDATVTISGATTDGLSVTDNNVDVSSSVVVSGSNLIYTIQNLSADHTIVVVYTPPVGGQTIFLKQNGSWAGVDKVFFKENGSWKEVETLSIKQNGSWVN